MNIDSLGGRRIEQLIEGGLVKKIPDLYRFDPDALTSVREIGDEIAESIRHFYEADENKKMLGELKELGVQHQNHQRESV